MHTLWQMRLLFEPSDCALFDQISEAQLIDVSIKKRMDTTVRRFLSDEALHLFGKLGTFFFGQGFEARTHRIHKELLANWKAHGQRIKKCRAKRITAIPSGGKRGIEVYQEFAHYQISHRHSSQIKVC
jgi:hypothetical protein